MTEKPGHIFKNIFTINWQMFRFRKKLTRTQHPIVFLNRKIKSKFNPAGNYMFRVNNRNTRTRCQICSKLTIKTPERRHCRHSGVFIFHFEHISHLVLLFLLLTLSWEMPAGKKIVEINMISKVWNCPIRMQYS